MTNEPTDPVREDRHEGVASCFVDSYYGITRYRDAHGSLHNIDGPAVIHPDKITFWLMTGRDPNTMRGVWFGYQAWFHHGERHRTDGPAIEKADGTVEYWVNGIQLTEEQFYQRYPEAQKNLATDDQT